MSTNLDPKTLLLTALHAKENGRARSTQVQIGPSELGGCRRKVWYRLNGQPETNDNELKLAAIMGTAIHTAIEQALADNKEVLTESEVEYNGMKAHVDLFIPSTGDVVDWKTVKVKNLSYFPSEQQRWQVQVYGYLISKSGLGEVKTVNLVAIPRDGDERDIKVHSEPYDESIALEALNWLEAIKASADAPAPERDESYCKFYCKYYDASGEMGCVGLKKGLTKPENFLIEDFSVDQTALKYLQLQAQSKEIERELDSIKESLQGFTGATLSGAVITWTPVAGAKQVDKDEVEKLLGHVPYKQGKETVRLNIKHTGGI